MNNSPRANAPADADDEAALVAALRAGEAAAFARLVEAHAPRLLAVTRRYLRDDADAQDALQDTFIAAFRSIRRFKGESKLSTWLQSIAIRAALMKLRSRRRRREEPIDALLPTYLSDGHRAAPGAAWDARQCPLERDETRRTIRACIDRLPDAYRTVLLLRDIDELDTDETARLLKITPGSVKVRLHRARQALRTLLEPHFTQGETC